MSRLCVLSLLLAAISGGRAIQSSSLAYMPTSSVTSSSSQAMQSSYVPTTVSTAAGITTTPLPNVSPSPAVLPYSVLPCIFRYPGVSPIVLCFIPGGIEPDRVECSFDGNATEICELSMSLGHLPVGDHTLDITAVDINDAVWKRTLSFTISPASFRIDDTDDDDDDDDDVQTMATPAFAPGEVRRSDDSEDRSLDLRTSEIVAIVVGTGEVVVAIIFIVVILIYYVGFVRKRSRGLYETEQQSLSFVDLQNLYNSVVIYNKQPKPSASPTDLRQPEQSASSIDLHQPEQSASPTDLHQPEQSASEQSASVSIYLYKPEQSSSPIDLQQPEQSTSSIDLQQPEQSTSSIDFQQPDQSTSSIDFQQPDQSTSSIDRQQPEQSTSSIDFQQPDQWTSSIDFQQPDQSTSSIDLQQPDQSTSSIDFQQPDQSTSSIDLQQPNQSTSSIDFQQPDQLSSSTDLRASVDLRPSASQQRPISLNRVSMVVCNNDRLLYICPSETSSKEK